MKMTVTPIRHVRLAMALTLFVAVNVYMLRSYTTTGEFDVLVQTLQNTQQQMLIQEQQSTTNDDGASSTTSNGIEAATKSSSLAGRVDSIENRKEEEPLKPLIPEVHEHSEPDRKSQAGQRKQEPVPHSATAAKPNATSKLHAVTQSLLDGNKIFLYQRNHMTGFGSVMLTFFVLTMYFEDLHQRQVFVLDESYAKSYRRSRNVGLPGFFDFHFPVIHNSKEYNRIFREFQTNGLGHLANEDLWVKNMWNRTTSVDYPILRIRQFKDPRYFQETRKKAMQHYELSNSNGKDLTTFERLSRRICDNVAFHKDMLQDVQEQLQQSSIPDFANSRQANDQAANVSSLSSLGTTVAFHVRRGDKVYGKRLESKLFLEDLYVKKLVRSVPSDLDLTSIQHCYVATDEYNVTLGLEQSLQKHNISCQLHYLVPQHRNKDNLSDRQSLEDTKSFFTELYLLTRATYFVGTFNSNVGAFVAPFRACHWKGEDRGTAANRFHHYYASYGVDKDHWFIRR